MHQPTAQALTSGPRFHFFGYYDKFQDSAPDVAGRCRFLILETDFMDRPPRPDDVARIGLIDDGAEPGAIRFVAETRAWCWQQSCMLQWLPTAPDRTIIYNDREGDRFVARTLDIESGDTRTYDGPIYCLSPDGRFALAPNFARLAVTRPGYGYEGVADPWADQPAPEDDGIWRMDLDTGERRLIVSLAQIASLGLDEADRSAKHWFNHLLVSPDARRFIFLNRWKPTDAKGGWKTRMFTANVDGSDIFPLNDHGMTSHFIWRDAQTVLAWARRRDRGDHYYLFTDRTDEVRALGPETLVADGHMSYRPQGEWIVTDDYPKPPDKPYRNLMLYHEPTGGLIELGRYDVPADSPGGSMRCDLHPRWTRDGDTVLFDSLHEGGHRRVYRIDVGDAIAQHARKG